MLFDPVGWPIGEPQEGLRELQGDEGAGGRAGETRADHRFSRSYYKTMTTYTQLQYTLLHYHLPHFATSLASPLSSALVSSPASSTPAQTLDLSPRYTRCERPTPWNKNARAELPTSCRGPASPTPRRTSPLHPITPRTHSFASSPVQPYRSSEWFERFCKPAAESRRHHSESKLRSPKTISELSECFLIHCYAVRKVRGVPCTSAQAESLLKSVLQIAQLSFALRFCSCLCLLSFRLQKTQRWHLHSLVYLWRSP